MKKILALLLVIIVTFVVGASVLATENDTDTLLAAPADGEECNP